jgi:hypothetical protein
MSCSADDDDDDDDDDYDLSTSHQVRIFLFFTKTVSFNVVHPLKICQHTKFHGHT